MSDERRDSRAVTRLPERVEPATSTQDAPVAADGATGPTWGTPPPQEAHEHRWVEDMTMGSRVIERTCSVCHEISYVGDDDGDGVAAAVEHRTAAESRALLAEAQANLAAALGPVHHQAAEIADDLGRLLSSGEVGGVRIQRAASALTFSSDDVTRAMAALARATAADARASAPSMLGPIAASVMPAATATQLREAQADSSRLRAEVDSLRQQNSLLHDALRDAWRENAAITIRPEPRPMREVLLARVTDSTVRRSATLDARRRRRGVAIYVLVAIPASFGASLLTNWAMGTLPW